MSTHHGAPLGTILLALAATLSVTTGCVLRPEPPRHLILVTVDTWRGDHVLGSRAGTGLTPELERLAAESVRFTDASSVANETTPGTAGILSGLIPHRSGVLVNGHELPEDLPTLTTLLKGAGFETRGLMSNPVLAPGHGFEHGFDGYRLLRARDGRVKVQADELTDAALELLDGRSEDAGRLFLWLHYLDPHGPYHPPAAHRARFPLEAFGKRRAVELLPRNNHSGYGGVPGYQQSGFDEPPRDTRAYLARYAAEVRFLDQELGRLIRELRDRGLLDSSLLVLTSDHGEALEDDHGYYFSHNNGQTVDQLHVPLMIRYPGCDGGSVVDRPVSTVDVLPTALTILGIDADVATDGIDLRDDRERVVVSQGFREISVRRGRWKAIWDRGEEPFLANLERDPGESRNLADGVVLGHAERMQELSALLRQVRERPVITRANLRDRAPDALRRKLEALGYL